MLWMMSRFEPPTTAFIKCKTCGEEFPSVCSHGHKISKVKHEELKIGVAHSYGSFFPSCAHGELVIPNEIIEASIFGGFFKRMDEEGLT